MPMRKGEQMTCAISCEPCEPDFAAAIQRNHEYLMTRVCRCAACAILPPAKTTGGGALELEVAPLGVTPSPSSKAPRYRGRGKREAAPLSVTRAKYRAKLALQPCTMPGCTGGQVAGGLCGAHYMEKRRKEAPCSKP